MESVCIIEFKDIDSPERIGEISAMHPRDIAEAIKTWPPLKIRQLFRKLPDALSAEIIAESPVELQVQLFESMRVQRLSGIIQEMFTDDAADILGQLTSARLKEVMASINPEDAKAITALLRYPEDTAGGIMQTEFIDVNENISIRDATETLRNYEDLDSDDFYYIYVTDDEKRLRGVLRMRDLLFRKPLLLVKDVMDKEVRCVSVHADQEEIAALFRNYHFSSLPVVDDFQKLRGVVTGDDVLEVIEEEVTEDMHRMVGLTGEEMIDTPWKKSFTNRTPWLFINLLTAFLAGWVVSLFEDTIQKYAMLAIFLPIIAGQGGNAGSQTLTIIVRALAIGGLQSIDHVRVLLKELLIGTLSGLAFGIIVGIVSWVWKDSIILGIVVCAAMLLNLVCAAIAGVLIPLGLKSLKIDPALASTIILTTVTDTVGFFLFLGFASLALQYFGVF